MLLSNIVGKLVYANGEARGVCLGVGISLKTKTLKYLLCSVFSASAPQNKQADFVVNAACVQSFSTDGIKLSHLRPVVPKNCIKFFLGAPVYLENGIFSGKLRDLEFHGFNATRLFTDGNACFPLSCVIAVSDAVILRKTPPFPLGQRIPAPILLQFSEKEAVVTKAVLRRAIKKSALIKLTLSLDPFSYGVFGG